MGNHIDRMNISRNILLAYLEGTLSKEETLDVQLYLAEHMDDPMVRKLLDEHFDSNRSDSSASSDKALKSVRNRLGMGVAPRRPILWLAAAVLALLLVTINSLR